MKQPQAPAKLSETEHPPEFDQILDLNNHQESTTGGAPLAPATPLIAFEDSITTSPKQEVPTAGKQKCRFRTQPIFLRQNVFLYRSPVVIEFSDKLE